MSWIKLGRQFNPRSGHTRRTWTQDVVKVSAKANRSGTSTLRLVIGEDIAQTIGLGKGAKALVSAAQNGKFAAGDGKMNGKLRISPANGAYTCSTHKSKTSRQVILTTTIPATYNVAELAVAPHRVGKRGLIVELPNFGTKVEKGLGHALVKKAEAPRSYGTLKRKRHYTPEVTAIFRRNAATARAKKAEKDRLRMAEKERLRQEALLDEVKRLGLIDKARPRIGDPDFPPIPTTPATMPGGQKTAV